MRPAVWEGPGFTNFGDALNLWLWDRVGLTPFFNSKPGLLYGIGTILNEHLPGERPLVVFGSGIGYGLVSDMTNVEVMFVRGPRTARLLGGVPWITDPAILTGRLALPEQRSGVVFMPHWETARDDDTLSERLMDVGIEVIDPRWPVVKCLDRLRSSSFVLAEAMHAAIVADALRIPWVPIHTAHVNVFKWLDWLASMEMPYEPAFPSIQSLRDIACDERWQLSPTSVAEDRLLRVEDQVELLRERLSR